MRHCTHCKNLLSTVINNRNVASIGNFVILVLLMNTRQRIVSLMFMNFHALNWLKFYMKTLQVKKPNFPEIFLKKIYSWPSSWRFNLISICRAAHNNQHWPLDCLFNKVTVLPTRKIEGARPSFRPLNVACLLACLLQLHLNFDSCMTYRTVKC